MPPIEPSNRTNGLMPPAAGQFPPPPFPPPLADEAPAVDQAPSGPPGLPAATQGAEDPPTTRVGPVVERLLPDRSYRLPDTVRPLPQPRRRPGLGHRLQVGAGGH